VDDLNEFEKQERMRIKGFYNGRSYDAAYRP
jgi:hypothetical protein